MASQLDTINGLLKECNDFNKWNVDSSNFNNNTKFAFIAPHDGEALVRYLYEWRESRTGAWDNFMNGDYIKRSSFGKVALDCFVSSKNEINMLFTQSIFGRLTLKDYLDGKG